MLALPTTTLPPQFVAHKSEAGSSQSHRRRSPRGQRGDARPADDREEGGLAGWRELHGHVPGRAEAIIRDHEAHLALCSHEHIAREIARRGRKHGRRLVTLKEIGTSAEAP